MNAPVGHRFPADLRASYGIGIVRDGGAYRIGIDLRNALLSGTTLSGPQVLGIDPATGVTKLYPLAGGADNLPPGGAVGNVLGITSLSPRTYGWLVPSGGGVAFGTTAGTATEGNDARVVGAMQKAANGSDIADKTAFRGNLGLGNAALATIGTTNGTVAAGNDSRFPTQALGNAAYRSVGSSSGTVAAGDDSRFPTQALGTAAYRNVGSTGGVASYDDPRFSQGQDISGKVDKANPEMARPPIILMGDARWLDQDNTIHAAWTSALDLTATTDMQPLLQSMLDKLAEKPEGGTLVLPASGRIRLDRSINWRQNKPISIMGLGNEESLQFYAYGGGALNLQSQVPFLASRMRVKLENFSIYSMAAGNIGVQCFEPYSISARQIRTVAWSAQNPDGSLTAPWYWFDKAWNLRNVRQNVFENIIGLNQHGTLAAQGGSTAYNDIKGTFFSVRGSDGNACTDLFFDKCRGQGFNSGWDMSSDAAPGIEGLFYTGCQAIGCNYGVIWQNTDGSSYVPPLLTWLDGHLHVYKSAFLLNKVAQVKINGGTIELHTQFDGIHGETSLATIQMINVGGFNIGDLTINNEPRSTSPIVCFGGCRNGFIHGIGGTAQSAPYGVQIIGGTSAIKVRDITMAAVTQAAVINGSTGGYTDTASCSVV